MICFYSKTPGFEWLSMRQAMKAKFAQHVDLQGPTAARRMKPLGPRAKSSRQSVVNGIFRIGSPHIKSRCWSLQPSVGPEGEKVRA